jgi:CheY-like chemotaxis protein
MSIPDNLLTILVTDDDENNRIFMSELVQSVIEQTSLQTAQDGETAVKLVNEKIQRTGSSFDLIFMDYKMPGMNGQETTLAIRQLEQATTGRKSIIITWSSAKDTPYLQADDWLPKLANKQDMQALLTSVGLLL